MAFNKTNAAHYLRRVYPQKAIDIIGMDELGAFFAMIRKSTAGFGESYDVGMEHGRLISSGADFTKAQTLASSTAASGKKFAVTETADYALARIQGNLLRKESATGDGMLKSKLVKAAERAFLSNKHRASYLIYGGGWGNIGRMDSTTTVTSDTIVLANKEDALKFDEGMKIVLSESLNAADLRNSGATLTVSKVNRSAGTVIVTASNMSTAMSADIAATDFIFVDGDRQDSATPSELVPIGFSGWIPSSAPAASEDFFGVDRSVDERLYGMRLAALNMSFRQALIEATFLSMNDANRIDTVFTHPANFKDLVLEATGQSFLTPTTVKASGLDISFDAATVMTDYGKVTVVMDRYADKNFSCGVRMSDWEMRSEGPWPKFLTKEGEMITVSDADQAELRTGGDYQFICHAPSNQVYIDHTS